MMSSRPNLLFIFSDQHRYFDLGCSGNSEVLSPNFDQFADESAVFSHCLSNSPVCVPARGSLLTGLTPWRHRAIANDLPIDPSLSSIGTVLGNSGYLTGYIGKWHLDGVPRDKSIPPERRLGFKEWKVANCKHSYLKSYYDDESGKRHTPEGYEPSWQTDLALDFIRRNREVPWSLHLSWGPPHNPYEEVPEKFLDRYDAARLSLRENVSFPVHPSLKIKWDEAQLRKYLRGYYAHITALDAEFGRILETLRNTGQSENTVVVYTSDHGDLLGSHGSTHKQSPWEESVRVPLMIRWPSVIQPKQSSALLGIMDLPATILGLMNAPRLENADGMDLHRLCLSNSSKGREDVLLYDLISCHEAEERGEHEWRSLRTETHKIVIDSKSRPSHLFDLSEDLLDACR